MATITPQGIIPHTANEYHDDLYNAHKAIDANWNLDPSSPDGLRIANDAEYLGQLDEYAVEQYASRDPAQAENAALDDSCALNFVFRFQSASAECTLETLADAGTVITAGSQVRNNSNDSLWTVTESVTAPSDIRIQSVEQDNIGVSPSDTWTIETPISGWDSALDASDIQLGRLQETNDELRARRLASVSRTSVGLVDSIYATISSLDGVIETRVYENTTDTESNGIAPNGIRAVVLGGVDEEIAEAIYNKKSLGCSMTGEVEIQHTSPVTGNPQPIRFDRPTLTDIFVNVEINNTASIPAPVITEIKAAIVAYSTGTLIPAGTARFNADGYQIGEDVKAFSLVTAINGSIGTIIENDPTIYVADISVSRDDTTYLKTVALQFDELAIFTEANISIVDPT